MKLLRAKHFLILFLVISSTTNSIKTPITKSSRFSKSIIHFIMSAIFHSLKGFMFPYPFIFLVVNYLKKRKIFLEKIGILPSFKTKNSYDSTSGKGTQCSECLNLPLYAFNCESEGRGFKSIRACQANTLKFKPFFVFVF